MKTPLCDLLDIEYPIIQGAMARITDGNLLQQFQMLVHSVLFAAVLVLLKTCVRKYAFVNHLPISHLV